MRHFACSVKHQEYQYAILRESQGIGRSFQRILCYFLEYSNAFFLVIFGEPLQRGRSDLVSVFMLRVSDEPRMLGRALANCATQLLPFKWVIYLLSDA